MKFKENSGAMDSKNYLRLKDKESAKGLFVGELYDFRTHWGNNRSYLCSEDEKCAHCNAGSKSNFRFRANIIIREGNEYVAKIFEQGWTLYEALRQLNSEYDLEKHLVKISRAGSGKNDTTYSVIPAQDGKVTPEMAKKLAAVQLLDLKHKEEPGQNAEPSTNADSNDAAFQPEPLFNSDEEIPF